MEIVLKAVLQVALTGAALLLALANRLKERYGAALTGAFFVALAGILEEVFLLLIRVSKKDTFSSTTGSGVSFLMRLSRKDALSSEDVAALETGAKAVVVEATEAAMRRADTFMFREVRGVEINKYL